MFDEEEKELMELGEKINSIPKPDCIDEYIKKGIEIGQKKKKRLKVKKFLNIAAAVIIIFVTSIRISPAFAKYISTIPGLEYIVKLINYDKGIKDAVDNNFVQQVNMSEEHEDLVFTIKDMIVDDSKAIVFYSIENKGDHRFVNISEIEFDDEKGEPLIASFNYGSFINKDFSVEKKLGGSIELNFVEETVMPDKIFVRVKLRDNASEYIPRDKDNILASTWNFEIPVDKKKFENMKKVYTINKIVEIEGQRIMFKDVTITPTRAAVKIEYDKNNSKKILRFDDISIVDENGEVRGTIKNGVSGSRLDDNNEILYFQSNYFNNPRELYITGSSIKALDKDKLTVIVDTDSKKLIKAPDNRLKFVSVGDYNDGLHLEFELEINEAKDTGYSYQIFDNRFKDSTGNLYYCNSAGNSYSSDNNQSVYLSFSHNTKFKNPIYLTIYEYPTRIKGDFKVKIK